MKLKVGTGNVCYKSYYLVGSVDKDISSDCGPPKK